jgi:2-alkyl-3-oxoalkanoate reductase
MKVLVTGGGGFLGSAICRLLRARGDDVLSVARTRHAALDALGVQQAQVDISDARFTGAHRARGRCRDPCRGEGWCVGILG